MIAIGLHINVNIINEIKLMKSSTKMVPYKLGVWS